jgi:hypothetical protein
VALEKTKSGRGWEAGSSSPNTVVLRWSQVEKVALGTLDPVTHPGHGVDGSKMNVKGLQPSTQPVPGRSLNWYLQRKGLSAYAGMDGR